MADPRGSGVNDPTSSGPSRSVATKSEMEGAGLSSASFRRTKSDGKLSGGQEYNFTGDLEAQLRAETSAKNELKAEVIRLNGINEELQTNLTACTADGEQKYQWIQRLDFMITEERNRVEQTAAHYASLLQEKDVQIRDMRRRHETQLIAKHHELEEHSKLAQNLAQLLEKERRDWRMEKDMLQSELDGTRQLLHEQEIETGRSFGEVQDSQEEATRLREELEDLTLKYEALMAEKQEYEQSPSLEAEFRDKEKELSELRSRLTQVTALIEENHNKTDAELHDLGRRLAEANNERDRLTAELYAFREMDPSQRPIAHPRSPSSSANLVALRERCPRLEAELEQVRFQLNEERAISQATQARLNDTLRAMRQLETDNNNLRSTMDVTRPQLSQSQSSDLAVVIHQNLVQLQDTLKAAQSQVTGIIVKKRSSRTAQNVSNLNISLQEAQHQVEVMTSSIEDSLGIQRQTVDAGPSRADSPQRRGFRGCLDFRTIFRSSSGISAFGGSRKNKAESNEKLKRELEDRRKECISLLRDNFTLEQCVRYLSARCQLYQTIHIARESRHRTMLTDRVLSSTSSRPHSRARPQRVPSTGAGEIQVDPLPGTSSDAARGQPRGQPRGLGQDRDPVSSSSSEEDTQRVESSSSLTKNLELKLLNKISMICEPFSQLTESPLVLSGLHGSSQTAPSIAG